MMAGLQTEDLNKQYKCKWEMYIDSAKKKMEKIAKEGQHVTEKNKWKGGCNQNCPMQKTYKINNK